MKQIPIFILTIILLLFAQIAYQQDQPAQQEQQQQQQDPNQQQQQQNAEQDVPQEQYLTWTVWNDNYKKRISGIQNESNKHFKISQKKVENFGDDIEKISQQLVKKVQNNIKNMKNIIDYNLNSLYEDMYDHHQAIIQFTEVFLFQRYELYEQKVKDVKDQLYELLPYTYPPLATCDTQLSCEQCTKNENCVWCTQSQKCVPGSPQDGAFFQEYECQFYMANKCTSNAQQVDNTELMYKNLDTIRQKNILLDSNLDVYQQEYMIQQQQELIQLKQKIELYRFRMNRIQRFYYRVKLQEKVLKEKYEQYKKERERKKNQKEDEFDITEYEEDGELWIETLKTEDEEDQEEQQQNQQGKQNGKNSNNKNQGKNSQQNSQNDNSNQFGNIDEFDTSDSDFIYNSDIEDQEGDNTIIAENNKSYKNNNNKNKNNSNQKQQQINQDGDNIEIEIDLDSIEDDEQQILDFVTEEMSQQQQ